MVTLAHQEQEQITPYFKEKNVQWPDNVIRLHIGEHPYGPSPHVMAELQKDLHHLNHYPNPTYNVLRQKLAEVYGICADQIVCGNGSEELLHLIPKTFVAPGQQVIMPKYAFKGIELGVLTCGGVPAYIHQEIDKQCAYGAEDVLSLITPKTRMIMLDHPGNPTCQFLARNDIRHILHEAHNRNILVVLDGAYCEYAFYSEGYALEDDWVNEFPNTIIVRTFSKAHALAALRLGWLHAAPDVIEAIYRIRLPYHINVLAQKAAVYALEDQTYMKDCVKKVIASRTQCLNFFKEYNPWSASTNFIVFPTGGNATWYGERLLEKGILTRPLNNYGIPTHIKIAMGDEQAMQKLYQEWKKLENT